MLECQFMFEDSIDLCYLCDFQRYKFIRGLVAYEHYQRRHAYLKCAAEWTSKAIVSLELTSTPIKSVKQAMQLEGVSSK